MAHMNMVQALNSAMDIMLDRDPRVVVFGEDVGYFGGVFRAFVASGAPALMTVYRNQGRWDTSNVIFDGRMVTLYDKQRRTRPAEDFAFIDYGLSALTRRAVEAGIPAGVKADLSDLFHALSLRGELAGYESPERFYEIGSPQGLADFSEWVRARG